MARTEINKTLWLVSTKYAASGRLNIGTVRAVQETDQMYYLDTTTYICYYNEIPLYVSQINKQEVGSTVFLSMSSAFIQAAKLAEAYVDSAQQEVKIREKQRWDIVKLAVRLVSEGKHEEE